MAGSSGGFILTVLSSGKRSASCGRNNTADDSAGRTADDIAVRSSALLLLGARETVGNIPNVQPNNVLKIVCNKVGLEGK